LSPTGFEPLAFILREVLVL